MAVKLRRYLRQDCVYWAKTGEDSSGRPVYATNPVQLKCRWEDGAELITGMDTRSIICNARVMFSQAVMTGGLLFLGTLADWRRLKSYPRVPTKTEGGWQIIMAQHIPDRKGRNFFYQALL